MQRKRAYSPGTPRLSSEPGVTVRPAATRLTAASGTLLLGGALIFAAAGAASATPLASATGAKASSAVAKLAPITHPETDTMGSTIRLHEKSASSASIGAPLLTTNAGSASAAVVAPPYGMDVSNYQGNINWPATKAAGASFVYIKATESTTYQNAYFAQQYTGSYYAGLIRGAYHFALPDRSSGATQALYFLAHGGGWSADGHTLPPMLDLEYNPYGSNVCFNLTPSQMVAWVQDFSQTMYAHSGRYPVIYTTENWWDYCTNYNASFGSTNPLFIARYASTVGPMPAGWSYQSLWQYNDHGPFPGDADVFNGSASQLLAFSGQPSTVPPPLISTTDPVDVYYTHLGGTSSYLGNPTSATYTVTGGEARNFQRGRIYYSASTGAHFVIGAILGHYLSLGGPDGLLGLPTTDETRAPDEIGRYNHFSGTGGSAIYWTPATGAHSVQGAIARHWAALGWERGFLGYPTSDESPTAGGTGRYNNFSRGGAILWTRALGAHETHGAIRALWAKTGYESGPLGYPTTDEYAVTGGRRSDFEHGYIFWNSTTYATVMTLS